MEKSAVSDRLREFVKSLGLSNLAFEKECGLYNGYVKDIGTRVEVENPMLHREGRRHRSMAVFRKKGERKGERCRRSSDPFPAWKGWVGFQSSADSTFNW